MTDTEREATAQLRRDIARFLRCCADAVESHRLSPAPVAQALFRPEGGDTIDTVISHTHSKLPWAGLSELTAAAERLAEK